MYSSTSCNLISLNSEPFLYLSFYPFQDQIEDKLQNYIYYAAIISKVSQKATENQS